MGYQRLLTGFLVLLFVMPGLAADYRLQAGDVVTISVWGEDELKGEARVTPKGRISFPLAGTITAKGKTVSQLERSIAGRLRKYIPEAQVSVVLVSSEGNKVYVVGKVNKPGVVPMSSPMRVMQALSLAGGITKFADEDEIRILREDRRGREREISVHYDEIMEGEDLSTNYWLRSGDTILVP
jgi:polysaccharide export outer membrane protein